MEEAAGQILILEDLTGMAAADAQKQLKQLGLTAESIGTGDTVTAQIPAPGQSVPGGSQILLYLGEELQERPVTVPDFTGMNRAQAEEAAGKLGLYIHPAGNPEISPKNTVISQNIPKETQVPTGTTVTLTFTDPLAKD